MRIEQPFDLYLTCLKQTHGVGFGDIMRVHPFLTKNGMPLNWRENCWVVLFQIKFRRIIRGIRSPVAGS
jgi:hypothetical protein